MRKPASDILGGTHLTAGGDALRKQLQEQTSKRPKSSTRQAAEMIELRQLRKEHWQGMRQCYSYSRGVQTERLLREQKHNFGACLSRQRYLPTNPKKTRVQNWTDLGSIIPIPFMAISSVWLRGLRAGWPGESALQVVTIGMGYGSVGTRASVTDPQLR